MKTLPDRFELAEALAAMLDKCEFKEEPSKGERVFSRTHHTDDRFCVKVFTSIINLGGRFQVREKDADAIRVCILYRTKDGSERGVGKSQRVFRVGVVSDVVDRTYKRMREMYAKVPAVERCRKCGAPTFISKKKKVVCAELCWKDEIKP